MLENAVMPNCSAAGIPTNSTFFRIDHSIFSLEIRTFTQLSVRSGTRRPQGEVRQIQILDLYSCNICCRNFFCIFLSVQVKREHCPYLACTKLVCQQQKDVFLLNNTGQKDFILSFSLYKISLSETKTGVLIQLYRPNTLTSVF